LNCWLEIEFLRNGHFWEFDFILLCSSQNLHNQPTGHGNKCQLIYKNHPVVRIRISEATDCKAKCEIDHNWEQIQAEIYIRLDREHFGLWTMTHCFFCYVNIMLIVFYVSGTIWAWPSRDSDTIVICRERHLLSCCRLPLWAMLTHGFISVSASSFIEWDRFRLSREQYRPREISIASTLRWASFSSYCPKYLREVESALILLILARNDSIR